MAQNYNYGEYVPLRQRRANSEIGRAIARNQAWQEGTAVPAHDDVTVSNKPTNVRFRKNPNKNKSRKEAEDELYENYKAVQYSPQVAQYVEPQTVSAPRREAPAQTPSDVPRSAGYYLEHAPNDTPVVNPRANISSGDYYDRGVQHDPAPAYVEQRSGYGYTEPPADYVQAPIYRPEYDVDTGYYPQETRPEYDVDTGYYPAPEARPEYDVDTGYYPESAAPARRVITQEERDRAKKRLNGSWGAFLNGRIFG